MASNAESKSVTFAPSYSQHTHVPSRSSTSASSLSSSASKSSSFEGPHKSKKHSTESRRKMMRDDLRKMAERDENERLIKREARLAAVKKMKEEIQKENEEKGINIIPGADSSKRTVRADIKQEARLSIQAKQKVLETETQRMKDEIDKKFGLTDLPKGDKLVAMSKEFYCHSGMPFGKLPERITKELTTQEIKDFRLVFDMFDAKNKGYISSDDLKQVASMLGFSAKRKVFKEMIDGASTDKKGRVSFTNFLDLIIKVQGDGPDPVEEFKQGFSHLDRGDKGYLTFADLRAAADELQVNLSNSAIRDMLKEADLTGNGVVTLSEFKQILAKASTFKTIV